MVSEQSIRKAFEGVKKDIAELKTQLQALVEKQERVETATAARESIVQIRSEPASKKVAKNKTSKKK